MTSERIKDWFLISLLIAIPAGCNGWDVAHSKPLRPASENQQAKVIQ